MVDKTPTQSFTHPAPPNQEVGGGWWAVGGGRWGVGGGKWEVGRWEMGGGRWEVGGGKWEKKKRSPEDVLWVWWTKPLPSHSRLTMRTKALPRPA